MLNEEHLILVVGVTLLVCALIFLLMFLAGYRSSGFPTPPKRYKSFGKAGKNKSKRRSR